MIGADTTRRRARSDLRRALELAPERLRRRVDPAALPFETTAEVVPNGSHPANTVHGLVQARLAAYENRLRELVAG
jgi:hypothetical protein